MRRCVKIGFRILQCSIGFGLLLLIAPGVLGVRAADAPSKQGIEFFEAKIRPVLVSHCFECHSGQSAKVKGGLRLDTRDSILTGGDTGPALVPGSPEKSLLMKSMRHESLKMPAQKLPANVLADFDAWIKMGAPDPRTGAVANGYKRMTLDEAKTFWAYQPVKKVPPPKVKDVAWGKTEIDRFVVAGLEAKDLKPSTEAPLPVLLRRITFDLIGLPPTPEQVDNFLKDAEKNRATAVEKVVDELLASPHFGERWGRHWLDLARYAESNGNADNNAFPNAWRFRDYTIASFNADKPYNQFIREQVAGDLLPAKDEAQKDEHLIATGFLALTSKPRAQNNPDYKMDLIADQIDVTSRAVLGLSVLCARCHDHKFDAISQKEYYALAGFFESSDMLSGASGKGGGKNGGGGGQHTLSGGGQAMGVHDAAKAIDTALCVRGDSTKRGETVQRGFIEVVKVADAPKVERSKSGRLQLADYLTRPDNPLTARVAVNRIWLHLFGQGLSRTPDNFGALGEKPTHPELLDWLTASFIESNWSTKATIRKIVLSRTYQQESKFDTDRFKSDPDNLSLWRANVRRLEGEPIRDAVLLVSGRLDTKPPSGSLAGPAGKAGAKGAVTSSDKPVRSVYLGLNRGQPLPELLALFDVANPNLVVAQREITTVPAQSLFLLNSPWVIDQAKSFGNRLLADKSLDDGKPNPATDAGKTVGTASGQVQDRNRGRALLPSPFKFAQRGQSGLWLSELFPNLARHADDLCLIQQMNGELLRKQEANPELEGVINSYELGFRMQAALPKLMDLGNEDKKTLEMYGINSKGGNGNAAKQANAGGGGSDDFGHQCLMARRLVEAGVRFVEVSFANWDTHNGISTRLKSLCGGIDQPIAALLADLKQRGLLKDTLVVWGGEFGRTPTGQGTDGRDHNSAGYSMWMAGGGVKGGQRVGATDDHGAVAVENKCHQHDLHATMLHLLGLDHQKLSYRYGGRDYSLTDIHGRIVKEVIA